MAKICELTKNIGIIETNLSDLQAECGALRASSLLCESGDTFVAVKGEKIDGHDFICTAVSRGASLIICERVTKYLSEHPEVPYMVVEDTRLALSHMWNEYCGCPGDKLILVGVTGTNGKTSTTYFLREIFKKAGYITGVIGTVKCLIGDECEIISDCDVSQVNSMTTPPPEKLYPMLSKMVKAGVEIVFMEVSSHSLMQSRVAPLRFEVGIFTGLSRDHLDYHGDMDSYYLAKRKLFDLCKSAVVNLDDSYSGRLLHDIGIPYLTYCTSVKNAHCKATRISCDSPDGISYRFWDKNISYDISCPIAGGFTVTNTLAAASCAGLFKIKPEVIAEALEVCPQIPGRMEHIEIPEGCGFDVFIDFAHTPDALEKVLHTLLGFKGPEGRLVCVFGCGGDRDKSKRPVMGRIAANLSDLTVITSDNSRSENPRAIISDILRGIPEGSECKVIENRKKAIEYAIEHHRYGDIILFAGKGHEDYEIDALGKHRFSEKEIILRKAEQLYCETNAN